MKRVYKIKGMHCRSCEVAVERELLKIKGVRSARASTAKKEVVVRAKKDLSAEVSAAVQRAGYELGEETNDLINKDKKTYYELLWAILLVFLIFFVFNNISPQTLFGNTLGNASLSTTFLIGLAAGVSSCMALVGGLVLGVSARHVEKYPDAKAMQKFRPHLFFNLGRLVSFFILGGLIGEIGSIFRLQGPVLGYLTIGVGVVMFVIGLQLTEVFPWLSSGFTLPKFFGRFATKEKEEYSHLNSFVLGALTFFLPCGFTQAMQVYAISTGSFLSGADPF